MKTATILLLLSVFGFSLYPTVQDKPQTDSEKARIKQTRRNDTYADPQRRKDGAPPISKFPGGTVIETLPGTPFLSSVPKSADQRVAEASILSQQITCSTSAIVRGTVSSVRSFVTADDSSIYSVYTFKVSDVLRGNVTPGTAIEVTGPGGVVVIDGKQITYNHPAISRLRLMEYVLFLKHDLDSDDYRLSRNEGIYAVFGESLARLDARNRQQAQDNATRGVPMNLNDLTTAVQAAKCK
jgi:hypothetical protein